MSLTLRLSRWYLVAFSLALGPAEAGAQPFAYITNFSADSVSVIDASTPTPTVTKTVPVGGEPQGVGVDPSGAFVYVANSRDGTVSIIDTSTNTVTATVTVGSGPFGVAVNPSGKAVYVANFGDGTVSVIDVSSKSVTTVSVGGNPVGVAVDPLGSFAYVTNFADGTLAIIDTAKNTVVKTLAVGSSLAGVAVNRDGTRVYVAVHGDAKVAFIDTASHTVVGSVSVGSSPFGVAVSPSGAFVYAALQGADAVSVVDVLKGDVSATVPVGRGPIGLSVHPSGAVAYVANNSDNTVSVIDTATNNVTTVAVGTGPYAFGQFIVPLAASGQQLTALGPASLWVGVVNSDDNGRRVDLRVEILVNGKVIGQGEALNQPVAGNALANATAVSIPLTLVAGPVSIAPTDALVSRVSVRRAGGAGGVRVRFWYGNSVPPPAVKRGWSRFGMKVDGVEQLLYYGTACPAAPCIRPLERAPGVAGVAIVLKATADYQSFGDWGGTLGP